MVTAYILTSDVAKIIAESTNAKITGRGAEDVVLFVGSGSTGAINKMVQVYTGKGGWVWVVRMTDRQTLALLLTSIRLDRRYLGCTKYQMLTRPPRGLLSSLDLLNTIRISYLGGNLLPRSFKLGSLFCVPVFARRMVQTKVTLP